MSIRSKIADEFEIKRREAQMRAAELRKSVYAKYPVLDELDREKSSVAAIYTRRLIEGEDVKDAMRDKLAAISAKKTAFLESIGLDDGSFLPKYACDLCEDRGIVDGALCRCFKKRLIEENFKSSNLGNFLKDQSFDKFRLDLYPDTVQEGYPVSPRTMMSRIYQVCTEFVRDFDTVRLSLFFSGPTGLGKTFLSTSIAHELLKAGRSVIYISAVDFFKRIEQSRFDSSNTDTMLFEGCDLLIIDDLGTEAPSVYATAVFSDILDKRMISGKKMILSTNYTLGEMGKLYGQRVQSRIAGYFQCLFFRGDDIRIMRLGKGK